MSQEPFHWPEEADQQIEVDPQLGAPGMTNRRRVEGEPLSFFGLAF